MNLMLMGKQWNWPYDDQGQMQDRDNSTEDVQLIPMLELTANIVPMQDYVEENGVYVSEDRQIRSLDGDFGHNDGMGAGDVLGDEEKELVVAGDGGHKIYIRDKSGNTLKEFDSVFSTGDKLAVADVMLGSKAEILVFHEDDGDVYVYSGEGHRIGRYNLAVAYESSDALAVGQVQGDEKAEIIMGEPDSGNVIIYEFYMTGSHSWGLLYNGSITDPGFFTANDEVGIADVDGDGLGEILVAENGEDRLVIFECYTNESGSGWWVRKRPNSRSISTRATVWRVPMFS